MESLTARRRTAAPSKSTRLTLIAASVCWIYLLALVVLMFYLRIYGDRAWLPTVLIFSPRWIYAAPIALLLPTIIYRRCWLPLVLLVVTALFPLMGFCIGWHRVISQSSPVGQTFRIVTFNTHHVQLGQPALKAFLIDAHPDVLALEEITSMKRRDFPPGLTHITHHGELCIASRYPIQAVKTVSPETAIRYTLNTPAGPVDLIGVHLSSPHWALRDSIDGTVQGPEELARNIALRGSEAALLKKEIDTSNDRPLLIAGDFNLAPDSPLFVQNFSSLSDAFESAGFGFGWTYFHQHTMVRIDHVVTNKYFHCVRCVVGPDFGSPHRLVIVDLVLLKN